MRRNDARLVYDMPAYNKLFPYMMKRRSDSLVYHSQILDVTNTLKYIRAYNAAKPEFRLKFFYVFCAAVMRMLAMRPEMNRFIVRNHYWQRNDYSLNFVVKEILTEDSPETSNPIYFRPDMTLMEYAKIIDDYINKSREVSKLSNSTDDTANLFLRFPSFIISFALSILKLMDHFGCCPKSIRDADGLHTSVFISNLGSIGIEGGTPHHHLYEWGTTSIFITIGSLERQREFDDDGKIVSVKETVEIGATLDERISSGFYFVKSIHYLQYLLNHPEELEKVPELPKDTLTKKEYKQKLKAKKKALKQAHS